MKARAWLLTINNDDRDDLELKKYIENCSSSLKYAVFQREVGEQGTEHFQIYIEFNTPIAFSTVKNNFPRAHIEKRGGSAMQARDYCMKEESRKEGHKPIEIGKFVQQRGKRTDLNIIVEMIEQGASLQEIREQYPSQYVRYNNMIRKTMNELRFEEFSNVFRKLTVTYIGGLSGVGKTRYVMEKYGYNQVYRITDYRNPWDMYNGQDIVIFEEFRNNLKIDEMLNYLDGYPLQLPARYDNKAACFTKVYILSNWNFHQQFDYVRDKYPETYSAWRRRVHNIYWIRNDLDMQILKNKDDLTKLDDVINVGLPF